MNSAQSIKIWGAGTSRTFRPVWVAEELGLDYEHVRIGPERVKRKRALTPA